MKRKSARAITLFALVAALAVGAAALPHEPGSAARHDSPYDLSFIDMMMMHHRQGLAMARLAEDRGQLPELKEFAQRVIADQEKDNSELQGLRDRFYAGEPKADKMRMGGMTMTAAEMRRTSEADMRKLQAATGGEFDRLFLDILTKHHQMAISMSRDAVRRAEHAEVKEFARTTIAKQTKDIGEMAQMKRKAGGARKGTNHRH